MTALHRHLSIVSLLAVLFVVSMLPLSGVHAANTVPDPGSFTYTPEIPIPGLFDAKDMPVDSSLMATYIRAIFVYFIWVVGIIATVMVIYGGIRWVAAAGNSGQIKEARDIVDNAIIGVIIALSSVVLLNIINPKLTKITVPGLQVVNKEYILGMQVKSVCPFDWSNLSMDDNVTCGKVKKVGTTTDSKGQTVDNYCMGTLCPYGWSWVGGTYGERRICSLNKSASGIYSPGDGCVKDVPLTPAPGNTDMRNAKTAEVTNLPFDASYSCGIVSPIGHLPATPFSETMKWRAGFSCTSVKTVAYQLIPGIQANLPVMGFLNSPKCYMIGNAAELKARNVEEFEATNMFCPEITP